VAFRFRKPIGQKHEIANPQLKTIATEFREIRNEYVVEKIVSYELLLHGTVRRLFRGA